MTFMLFFVSADPSLGKVDKASLSSQTLMELFIAGITENKEIFYKDVENPKDIFNWHGVKLDDSNEVTMINWYNLFLKGTIPMQWIPPRVTWVCLGNNSLSGTVDLTCLPHLLIYLDLSYNQFVGTIDLTRLPSGIERLFLHRNKFHGDPGFGQLPASLRCLYVNNTSLEGNVHEFGGELIASASYVNDMRKK